MGFVRPPISLLVPVVTRLVYVIYAGLAIAASEEALRIFDKDAEHCGDEVCKRPIEMCSLTLTGQECMDAGPIKSTVTVAMGVSVAAIILYVILDLVVRCRKGFASKPWAAYPPASLLALAWPSPFFSSDRCGPF